MKMYWLLFLAFGVATCDKLDRTYLPPPGSKLAGGSPGAIDVPLEFPKLHYSTTTRPQYFVQEDVFPTYTEDNQPILVSEEELRNQNPSGISQKNYGEPSSMTRLTERPTNINTKSAETFPPTSKSFDYSLDSTIPYNRAQFPIRKQQQINVYPNKNSDTYQFERRLPAVISQQPGSKITKVTQPTESQVIVAYDENDQPIYNQPVELQDVQEFQNSFVTPSIFPAIRRPSLATPSGMKELQYPSNTQTLVNDYTTQRYPLTEFVENKMPFAVSPVNVTQENKSNQKHLSPDNSKSEDINKQNDLLRSQNTAATEDTNPKSLTAETNKYLSSSPSSVLPASIEKITSSSILNGVAKPTNISPAVLNTRTQKPKADSDKNAFILKNENFITPEGDFAYNYDTSNGIHADESGSAAEGVKAFGSYSYTGDDGNVYTITYTADENGFQPQGSHLPTPPPIPEAILRVLEKNAKDEVAGIEDDGSYDDSKYGYKKYKGAMESYYSPEKEKVLAKDNDNFKIGDNIVPQDEDQKIIYDHGKPKPTLFHDGSDDNKDYTLIESEEDELSTRKPDNSSSPTTRIPILKYQTKNRLPSKLRIDDIPTYIDNVNKGRRPVPSNFNIQNKFDNNRENQDDEFVSGYKNEPSKLINTQKNMKPEFNKFQQKGLKSTPNQNYFNDNGDYNDEYSKKLSPDSKTYNEYKDFSTVKPVTTMYKNSKYEYSEPDSRGQVFAKVHKTSPQSKVDNSKYQYIPPATKIIQMSTVPNEYRQNHLSTVKPITYMSTLRNKDDNNDNSVADENIDESEVFDNNHQILDEKPGYTTSIPITVTKFNMPQKYEVTKDGTIIPVKVFGQNTTGGKPFQISSSQRPTLITSTTERPLIKGNASRENINQPQTTRTVTKPSQRFMTLSRQPVYTTFSTSTFPSTLTDVTSRPVSYKQSYPGEAITSTTSRPTIIYPDDTIVTDYEDTLSPDITMTNTETTNSLSGFPTTSYRPGSMFTNKFVNSRPTSVDEYGRPIVNLSQPNNIVVQNDFETHPGYSYPSPNESRTVSEGNSSYGPVKGQSLTKISTAKPYYGTKTTKVYGEDFSGPKQAQTYDEETGYHYK